MNTEMYRMFFNVQTKHWWFVTRKRIVLDTIDRYLEKPGDLKILDIGCGTGVMLNALGDKGKVCGMDMSDEAINFAREVFSGPVERGSLPDDVPYEKNSFDLVTALDVIEHVDRDLDSLETIHSLLAPGGKVIITVPAYMFLWSAFDDLNEHKRRYTRPELERKLEEAGFRIEKLSYYNTFLFPVVFAVRMLNKLLKRDGASDVEMPGRAVNSILEAVFGVEKYMLRYVNFPFGVSVLAVARK